MQQETIERETERESQRKNEIKIEAYVESYSVLKSSISVKAIATFPSTDSIREFAQDTSGSKVLFKLPGVYFTGTIKSITISNSRRSKTREGTRLLISAEKKSVVANLLYKHVGKKIWIRAFEIAGKEKQEQKSQKSSQ